MLKERVLELVRLGCCYSLYSPSLTNRLLYFDLLNDETGKDAGLRRPRAAKLAGD